MAYFTKAQVRQSASDVLALSNLMANESTATIRLSVDAQHGKLPAVPPEPAGKPPVTIDIFLAHSSLDEVAVLGLFHLLRNRGYSVYLDRICDPQLNPGSVTRETARVLRYRLAQCRSLFIATSDNTPGAKWVPWELGFSDGWNGKTAIMPIVEAGVVTFDGREYFELYPEVRDAAPTSPFPRDLDIFDRGHKWLGAWPQWTSNPRTF